MKNYEFILLIVVSLIINSSCNKSVNKFDFFKLEGETLEIDLDYLKKSGYKLRNVDFLSKNTRLQGIKLDSSFRINKVYTFKKNNLLHQRNLNNWIALNYDGNLDIENSYFYESIIYLNQNKELYVDIHFQTSKYENGLSYILYNDIDEKFFISKKNIDTVFFKDEKATFPILNTKKGINKIRFVIVDESRKDKIGKLRRSQINGTLTFDL